MSLFLQFLKELGPGKVVATAVFMVVFTFMSGVYIYKSTSNSMVPLYSDLAMEDSNKIVSELESQNIKYEIIAGGSIIKVPEAEVLRLRMTMAERGIPEKGSIVGYEIFDKGEGLNTSSFLQNINYLRALEGELGRTIASISPIEKARVHLVIPKRELFSREKQTPRASIVLKIKGNKTLNKHETDGIAHLIATAVPELEIKNISIMDSNGVPLRLGANDDNNPAVFASQGQDYKISYENRLKHIIEDLLTPSVGAGKVKAHVTIDINFDRVVTNSEVFDPNKTAVRSSQITEENEKTPGSQSDDISVANNLPDSGNNSSGNSNAQTIEKKDETINYEISKTVQNLISETGTVRKLSIAVLVDGEYKLNSQTNLMEYNPRTKDEMQKYESLVKSAVGFDSNRNDVIEIINMQFAQEQIPVDEELQNDWLQENLPGMVQTIVIAIVIVLLVVLVIKPIATKAFEINNATLTPRTDALSLLTETSPEANSLNAIDSLRESMKAEDTNYEITGNSYLKKVNDLVEKYPQEALSLIRRWLNEE